MPPSTGNYAYADDLGVNSIPGLTALVQSAGINFRVGSSFRPGDPGWHGTQNAIDVFTSVRDMERLARYLIQYEKYLGELLYTPPTAKLQINGRVGPGYYVDNGARLNTASLPVAEEHRDHIHLAATNSALWAMSEARPGLLAEWRREEKKRNNSTVSPDLGVTTARPATRGGCLSRAAVVVTAASLPVGAIGYTLHTLLG